MKQPTEKRIATEKMILELLKSETKPAKVVDIAQYINMFDDRNDYKMVTNVMLKLLTKGTIEKCGHGTYKMAVTTEQLIKQHKKIVEKNFEEKPSTTEKSAKVTKRICTGFVLLKEYPGCNFKAGDFLAIDKATARLHDYPALWRPVYKENNQSKKELESILSQTEKLFNQIETLSQTASSVILDLQKILKTL